MPEETSRQNFRYARFDNDDLTLQSLSPAPAVPDVFFSDMILQRLREHDPSSVILRHAQSGETVTAKQLISISLNAAHLLTGFGLTEGDVVFAISGNRPIVSCLLLPLAAIGAVYTARSPTDSLPEMVYRVQHCDAKTILCDTQTADRAVKVAADCCSVEFIVLLGEHYDNNKSSLKPIKVLSIFEMTTHTPFIHDLPLPHARPKEAAAYITYTSGSTGFPKGFLKSHQNIVAVLTSYEPGSDFLGAPGDIFYCDSPPIHEVEITLLLSAMYCGYTVILEESFDIARFPGCVEKHRITHSLLSSPETTLLAKACTRASPISSLKRIISVGSTLPAPAVIALQALNPNIRIIHDYGMTECGQICAIPEDCPNMKTVGNPHQGVAIRIRSVDSGHFLGPNQPGEIEVRTTQLILGYLRNPEANAEHFSFDGWIRTGDLAYFDEEGLVYIVDRIKDVIKCNGVHVSPSALETLLLMEDGVEEAAVVGVPDDTEGEVPWAFVVFKNRDLPHDDDQLQRDINLQVGLASHLRRIVVLESIPKSGIGKFDRKALRALYQPEYAGTSST